MTAKHHPHVHRVLQALHSSRQPGWMFPGHFLDITFEADSPERTAVGWMTPGGHCSDSQGRVSMAALGVFADVVMAAAARSLVGRTPRVATMSMRLSLGEMPSSAQPLRAQAKLRLLNTQQALVTAAVSVEIEALGQGLVGTGEATFAVLDNKQALAGHPLPADSSLLAPLSPEELSPAEQQVYQHALDCVAAEGPPASFLERFWSLSPLGSAPAWEVPLGRHNGNRSGHLQGGIQLGLAIQASLAAVPGGWVLADISAQYLEPGDGAGLQISATPLRLGRNAATVQARLNNPQGRSVIEAQANLIRHSAAASAPAARQPDLLAAG